MSGMDRLAERLAIPVIGAPMTDVSSVRLTLASCRAGIVGSFPATNASSTAQLGEWLAEIDGDLTADDPPYAVNFPLYRSGARMSADIDLVLRSGAGMVISSVGSPKGLVAPVHAAGKLLYADVASVRHATLAVEAGVDGLILLTAGAGGYTGWANPFVFVRAVREFYDGPVVMAGGMSDGRALWAALALGCDLAYLGTALIPAVESVADEDYKRAVVGASMDHVKGVTVPATGLVANTILDPDHPEGRSFTAGHSAHGSSSIEPVAAIVERFRQEYDALPSLELTRAR